MVGGRRNRKFSSSASRTGIIRTSWKISRI